MSADLPAILGGLPVVSEPLPQWPPLDTFIEQVFAQLIATGDWGRYHAHACTALQDRLQQIYGCEQVQLTSSGTVAVELALRGLPLQPGDEVLLSAYDFKANFTNITLLGGVPVLVDIRPADAQLDVTRVAAALSPRTRAILVSHLHGGLVDVASLQQFATEHQLCLIEDCCQLSPGTSLNERPLGTSGDVTVLSFGGSKLLTAGRGGAVLMRRPEIAQRIRLYTQRGNDAYPLSEMQAALLLAQFENLEQRRQQRQRGVAAIRAALHSHPQLRLFPEPEFACPDYYKLGLWYAAEALAGLSREKFCAAMQAEGIPIFPGFEGLHRIHARRRFRTVGELPESDRAHAELVVLHHPWLQLEARAGEWLSAALDKLAKSATILPR